jgi:hypothetical protein
MKRRRISRWWGVLALGTLACDDAATGSVWTGTVRDSAGVRVVDNPDQPDTDAPWTAGSRTLYGDLFGTVADIEVDDAGRVYVLDGQASVVSVFGPDGTALAQWGGPGEGPGELSRFAASLWVLGDTTVVADWGRSARIRFDGDGEPVETRPLPTAPGARSWWRRGRDGRVWFRSLTRFVDDAGRWGGLDELSRIAPDGEAEPVLTFEYAAADLGGPGDARVPLLVNAPSWDVGENGTVGWLAVGEGRIHIHGEDGGPPLDVRRPSWQPTPPSLAARDTLLQALADRFGMLGADPAMAFQMDATAPESLPAITSIRAGPDGTWWIQRLGSLAHVHPTAINNPDPPTGWGGGAWDVVDASGRYQGTVQLPAGTRVARIREDAVYVVLVDEFDVERVARIALDRR